MPTLPKREILCLTRAASLQNKLEKKDGKTTSFRENKELKKRKGSKEIRKGLIEI